MKRLTYDTLNILMRGLSKRQKDDLRKLGYDEEIEDVRKMYEYVNRCYDCSVKDRQIEILENEKEALRCNREYFDTKFQDLKNSIKSSE